MTSQNDTEDKDAHHSNFTFENLKELLIQSTSAAKFNLEQALKRFVTKKKNSNDDPQT